MMAGPSVALVSNTPAPPPARVVATRATTVSCAGTPAGANRSASHPRAAESVDREGPHVARSVLALAVAQGSAGAGLVAHPAERLVRVRGRVGRSRPERHSRR